ncbi:MAG: N-acetyltransferase family protein [Salinibacter sp.]
MPDISVFRDSTSIAELDGPPSASSFERDAVVRQAPDLHLVVSEGARCTARCSLWWTDTPDYEDHTVGLVGHYAAVSSDAGQKVLDRGCRRLADEGCTCAIGPMDGATWYPYRFVTERGDRPPFVLEPWHPPGYPTHFRDTGFEPMARYVSSMGADADILRNTSVSDSPPLDGVHVRPLNLDRFDAELRRLHALATASFADNFLYTPVPETDFLAHHQEFRPFIDPTLVRLAEQEGNGERRLVGIAFLVPDVLQAERGETVDTAIFKTLAVHPDVREQGLGRWLTDHMHGTAWQQGYQHVIHALMHEDNISRRLGYGSPLRRYALFWRELP